MNSTENKRSKDYDTQTILLVARAFVENPEANFERVGACFNMSTRMASNLIYRGIAENILSNDLSHAIYDKILVINKRGYRYTYSRWDEAFDKRSEKRNLIFKKLRELENKKTKLDFIIITYNMYVSRIENPLPLDILIDRSAMFAKNICAYKKLLH